ncbi:glycosyltransferase [Ralstonia soli]|uniref:Glycosyltransferase n=1 Tax=Ralstonia soli TaxID=2953896 RepID=A0ABT1AGQ2_9RALS|nr:glycosyltransferase [Ralstonia soli]MCO5397496.1 glycosyltransferase [Ralstonia soli]
MKIIVFGHPAYMGSPSMNGFATMVADGMRSRGHDVELWRPEGLVRRLGFGARTRKWFGYVDQYLVFPVVASLRLQRVGPQALVVLCDHALGMWMPLLFRRPHVIHSHDFNPQRELAGDFPSRRLRWSGRLYQRLIRKGFGLGRTFIAVSQATARDLARFHPGPPPHCEVVYNGLNYPYHPLDEAQALDTLQGLIAPPVARGMLLHVGGNPWYKNRLGVLSLYLAYCRLVTAPRPLWMIGAEPTAQMRALAAGAAHAGGEVRWLVGLPTEAVHAAYALASVFVFPSLEEGFGWPIIEAMACGTPVLTTDRAPMSEISGGVARLIERMPENDRDAWATRHAPVLAEMASWPASTRQAAAARGLAHAAGFSAQHALDQYERIYLDVLQEHIGTQVPRPARE